MDGKTEDNNLKKNMNCEASEASVKTLRRRRRCLQLDLPPIFFSLYFLAYISYIYF
jgi:hypothetical protein